MPRHEVPMRLVAICTGVETGPFFEAVVTRFPANDQCTDPTCGPASICVSLHSIQGGGHFRDRTAKKSGGKDGGKHFFAGPRSL